MFEIKTYNKISQNGLSLLGDNYTVGDEVANPDGAIVRSASLHDTEFSPNLKAIARAGAGTNNIPIDRCSENGIVVFNTPGANANAVKELVIAGLLLSSRKVVAGIDDKNFAPDKAIERQQLCVMRANYAKLDGVVILPSEAAVTFNDSLTISNYAREAVSLCQRADIVNGYVVEDGVEFRAKNTATRAEAAQILYKFHKNFVIAK